MVTAEDKVGREYRGGGSGSSFDFAVASSRRFLSIRARFLDQGLVPEVPGRAGDGVRRRVRSMGLGRGEEREESKMEMRTGTESDVGRKWNEFGKVKRRSERGARR